jgi:hypothetical protein
MPELALGDEDDRAVHPLQDVRLALVVEGLAAGSTFVLAELGDAASEYQRRTLRNLNSTHIECDEIWAFCHAKQENVPEQHAGKLGYGDLWTWTAIDADIKGDPGVAGRNREADDAYAFIADLCSRLANRVQLTTDGHLG